MKLFISYAHIDKPIVKDWIVSKLQAAGHEVWFDDRLVAGQDWQQQLGNAIYQSDALIYAITPESIASEWCLWELAKAVQFKKGVVPVLMQARTEIPSELSQLQYVDFSNGPTGDAVARLMGGLQQLSASQVAFAPENPRGKPTEAMTNEKLSRTHIIRNVFGAITATILFLATVTSALPEQTRDNIFMGLGVLQPSPTLTLMHTPTKANTPTSTNVATMTPSYTPATISMPAQTSTITLATSPITISPVTPISQLEATVTVISKEEHTVVQFICITKTIDSEADSINVVRIRPSFSSRLTNPIQPNSDVYILDMSQVNWLKIYYGDDNMGWIPTQYVIQNQNCSNGGH